MMKNWGFNLLLTAIFMAAAAQKPACQPTTNAAPAKVYRGQRISLYGFKIMEQTEKQIVVRCHAVNTGRDPVSFSREKPAPDALLVEIDSSAMPPVLSSKTDRIAEVFLKEKISLSPGQLVQNLALKIPLATQPKPQMPKSETAKAAEKPVRPAPVPPEKTPPPPTKKAAEKPTEMPGNQAETPVLEDNGQCPDLVFDTAFVVKKTDKMMLLRFSIFNRGKGIAKVVGPTDEREDNLAVNVYFVSGVKLTRGAFLADGVFLKEKDTFNGLLLPGKRIEGEIEISLKNRTKFQPNFVFELDPFQTITECDKTNNTRALVVPE